MTTPMHFDGHPIAPWLLPRLEYARRNGWRGVVISGYRTNAQQLAAASHYAAQLGKTVRQVYPEGPLASNHCGLQWPRGAVDVTEPEGLNLAMDLWRRSGRKHPAVWGGPVIGDNAHFSSNGH
jgi:hypothetical protein